MKTNNEIYIAVDTLVRNKDKLEAAAKNIIAAQLACQHKEYGLPITDMVYGYVQVCKNCGSTRPAKVDYL